MKYEFGWTFLNKETGKLRRIVSFSFNKGNKIMMLNSENKINKDKLNFMVNGVSFNMILVEHGSFMMGATEEQEAPKDVEKPAHKVIITRDYYIGETLVTQELFKAVMGDFPLFFEPSEFKGEDLPVEHAYRTYFQEFIGALNWKLRTVLAGKKFRLPTEAEWEFAARGGNKSKGYKYAGSNNLCEVAWYSENSNNETHPVAKLKPNELGIYDMSGNVSEWCQDKFYEYSHTPQTNPIGLKNITDPIEINHEGLRICRGGSWYNEATLCRVSDRGYITPMPTACIGMRLVLSDCVYETPDENAYDTHMSEEEKLYRKLCVPHYLDQVFVHDLGEGIASVKHVMGTDFKPRYLMDKETKCAYEFISDSEILLTVTDEDIDWDSLKGQPQEVLDIAKAHSFHFSGYIHQYYNGVAEVEWWLNPDGVYDIYEEGGCMPDDKEVNLFGAIDRKGKVVKKFRLKKMTCRFQNRSCVGPGMEIRSYGLGKFICSSK